jgi:uncharacterized protein DUF4953/uncharacterized protein DUF5117
LTTIDSVGAEPPKPASAAKPDFPPFAEVTKDFVKVVSTMDGKRSLYTIWIRKKDNQMLAELPSGFDKQKHFIALTTATGGRYAGLQEGDRYVYWRRYGKRLALIEPNTSYRSTGDPESKASVQRLFTDQVILDVPIVTLSPSKSPVIDMNALLIGNASAFFGIRVNPKLARIKTAKAFPNNVEIAFEAPVMLSAASSYRSLMGSSSKGQLKTLHYSISLIPDSTGYKPRPADERIGYFLTSYSDLGKYDRDQVQTRLINRWHLEKADPSLKLSPPKNPIIFYIEYTTPRRYRYWVKKGLLYWNKAFERVGIRDAIEVRQQDNSDPKNPKHMDKDPEDVNYNFVRWLNNNIGTAIGPSRVHPLTGQILDADIILTDGWIRHFEFNFHDLLPKLATEGFSPKTLGWLDQHPRWDPRIALVSPSQRIQIFKQRRQQMLRSELRNPGSDGTNPFGQADPTMIGDDQFDGLLGHNSQVNGLCLAAEGKSIDLQMLRMALQLEALTDDPDEDDEEVAEEKDEDKDKEKDQAGEDDEDKDKSDKDGDQDEDQDEDKKATEEQLAKKEAEKKAKEELLAKKKAEKKAEEEAEGQKLDGIPENFIGPLLAEVVTHEVGHTLGLRHNFKASTISSLEEINADNTDGKKGRPHAGSVMDYLPINMTGKKKLDYRHHAMVGIGPYDMWAIEYGYSFDKDLKPILARVAEPDLVYGTDEDTYGPDPRARRYDFGKNPLKYAKSQMELASYHRQRLLDKFVKDGESWSKAREGYEMTLGLQVRSLSMMANWIGGVYIYRDKKGDKNAHQPLTVVAAEQQREALEFVINNAFLDQAFGLSPELLLHLSTDYWMDGVSSYSQPDWPVHDRIMGIQSSVLTMIMNPDTLQLTYDNEMRTPEDQDTLTLPEMLNSVKSSIWSELENKPTEKSTARKPWISSLRRNLQREHLERLIDLILSDDSYTAAYKPISNLARVQLRALKSQIENTTNLADSPEGDILDPYTRAHLGECKLRIEKALDANYTYQEQPQFSLGGLFIIGQEPERPESN